MWIQNVLIVRNGLVIIRTGISCCASFAMPDLGSFGETDEQTASKAHSGPFGEYFYLTI